MDQYVSQFSQQFITRAFTTIKSQAGKVLERLNVPVTDDNKVKLLKAVSNAIEQGTDWEPPAALIHVAETKARIQYNTQVQNLLNDLDIQGE